MTANVNKWSKTALTNGTADPDINWVEGQLPSTVNNSARAVMQGVATNRDDQGGYPEEADLRAAFEALGYERAA